MFTLSQHIQRRMSERNIQLPDIEMLFSFGEEIRVNGRTAWYMPRSVKKIPKHLQKLILIATPEHHAITAYWSNTSSLHAIKKLMK